jgi:phosphate:Na+ symporter
MAITMSVLITGAISLQDGMAVALGSEVGTTIKVVLAAMGGSADKKRVALGNFLFNLISTILFMFLLSPMDHLIREYWHITTLTIALVMFQSIVNLTGIILFLPILGRMGNWLNNRFSITEKKALFLTQQPVADTYIAMETLRNEVLSLLQHVLIFSRHLFGHIEADKHTGFYQKDFEALPLLKQYDYIKIQHGEIFDFFIRMQDGSLKSQEIIDAERLATAARNATYAAKSFRDCVNDVEDFSDSGKDNKFSMYEEGGKQMAAFAYQMEALLFDDPTEDKQQALLQFHHAVQQLYRSNIKKIYSGIVTKGLKEIEVTSALNLNREITTGLKSLSMAAKDLLLNDTDAAAFDELPGFIR